MIDQRVGNYRIVRQIARGGVGVVYEAENERIHSRVAIKVLSPQYSGDPELVERLFTEAKAVNQIDHPGLLRIQDCGQLPDGNPYLVMELLRGESLRQRLDRGPLRAAERSLLIQVAEAMAAAHEKGIVHRDLTPNNIMLLAGAAGQVPSIKVLDFGLAKVSEELRSRGGIRPRTSGLLGTVEYIAPEQWEDASQVNDRADVYALGVILYEALCGQRPFSGTLLELMRKHTLELPPPLRGAEIPPDLASLCLAMMSKRAGDRPSMREVAERLRPRVVAPPLSRVGNFKLGRVLGQGGYGTVYEATHEHLDERRAIKVLSPGAPEPAIQRFFNEARSASRVRHAGIVEIFDCGTEQQHPYLVMELLPGGSLQDLLESGAAVPLSLYQQVAVAMAAAHEQGIVHRDLKPDNVMLRRTAQGLAAKVVDFGIAKLDAAHFGSVVKRVQSRPGQPLGTPRFMAPEQWKDASTINDRADVYSVGVMLYQALSGRLPFQGQNPLQLMMQHLQEAPPPLASAHPLAPLVLQMLAKEPAQRPSMAEVARALSPAAPVVTAAPVVPVVPVVVPRPAVKRAQEETAEVEVPLGWLQRNRRAVLLGVALPSAAVVVALAVPWSAQHTGGQASERSDAADTRNQADVATTPTPKATPLPKKISVVLRSEPPGATVHRKGTAEALGDTGTTGLPLELDPGQSLALTISKSAYVPVQISLGPGDAPRKIVKLELAPP